MIAGAFAPVNSSTGLVNSVTQAATAAAANSTLPTPRTGTNSMRVCNTTAQWAYINFGTASVAAATVANSMPFAPGSVEVLTIDASATTASVILASGTGNVTFTAGEGV